MVSRIAPKLLGYIPCQVSFSLDPHMHEQICLNQALTRHSKFLHCPTGSGHALDMPWTSVTHIHFRLPSSPALCRHGQYVSGLPDSLLAPRMSVTRSQRCISAEFSADHVLSVARPVPAQASSLKPKPQAQAQAQVPSPSPSPFKII